MFQAGSRAALFSPLWSTYGRIELNASESGHIITNFTFGYEQSFVECLLNGEIQNSAEGKVLTTWASGSSVALEGDSQNLIELIVTNREAAISTTYDVTIVRPLTFCTAEELSDW